MVDIHHHLLPGLDDGATSLDLSVDMARLAAAEGITHIVCTPHANSQYTFDSETNSSKLNDLRARLSIEEIPLTLGTGCDFHLSYDNVHLAKEDPTRFSINGLGYLLVEVPDYGLPPAITETFYELQLAGLTPILTHPERNPTLQNDLPRLADWLRAGVLIQITADSLTGHKGRKAAAAANKLIEKRWVHFLATDAHNTSSRPPRMRDAYNYVAERFGEDYAHSLCVTNPLAVFLGQPFVPLEDLQDLYKEPKQPGLWERVISLLNAR